PADDAKKRRSGRMTDIETRPRLPLRLAYRGGSFRDHTLMNAGRRRVACSGCASLVRSFFCLESRTDSETADNLCDVVARVEHAGLYGAWRNPNDRRDLVDGPTVVVDEIDDLAMRGRQPGQAVRKNRALLPLLDRCLGIVRIIRNCRSGAVVQSFHPTPAQHRQRAIARDRQQPSRDSAAALESARVTPDVEEHLTHQVLGGVLVIDQTQRKTVDAQPM